MMTRMNCKAIAPIVLAAETRHAELTKITKTTKITELFVSLVTFVIFVSSRRP